MKELTKRKIDEYAQDGWPIGGFLTAVMRHDLFEAVSRADSENLRDLPEIVQYICSNIPSVCHGRHPDVVAWWQRLGGLTGYATLTDKDRAQVEMELCSCHGRGDTISIPAPPSRRRA